MDEQLTGYELSRNWFDFCFDNTELIKPAHTALYFFAIEHCNRMGWKTKFGFPTQMAMEAVGIKNYKTYINTLNDLIDWGFIKLVSRSKNQYSATVIGMVKNTKALSKALSKAVSKHAQKHSGSIGQSIVSIDKPKNLEPKNLEPKNEGRPRNLGDLKDYFFEKIQDQLAAERESKKFWDHYQSNGWKIGGKSPMKDWKAAVRQWVGRIKEFSQKTSNEKGITTQQQEYLAAREDI